MPRTASLADFLSAFLRTAPLALPLTAAALGLGFWQLERLAWKEGLLAARAAGQAAPPLALTAGEGGAGEGGEPAPWRRVVAHGRFAEAAPFMVGPRGAPEGERGGQGGQREQGAWVFAPFVLEAEAEAEGEGELVWVLRGWVPFAEGLRPVPAAAPPLGRVALGGTLREGGWRGPAFLRPRLPEAGGALYAYAALEAFRRAAEAGGASLPPLGLATEAGLYVVAACTADRQGSGQGEGAAAGTACPGAPASVEEAGAAVRADGPREPVAVPPLPALRNEHRNYARTWFSLAAALLVGWFFLARSRAAKGSGQGRLGEGGGA